MRLLLIVIVLTGSFGCATTKARFDAWFCGSLCKTRPSGSGQYFGDTSAQKWAQEEGQKHKAEWAEWDRKYVSDDVIIVEIIDPKDPNGLKTKPKR